MDSVVKMSCWEVMNCDRKEACPAWLQAPTPCWEIARELDDYRSAMNVCGDCIVYVLNHNMSMFSEQEIEHIKARKNHQKSGCIIHEKSCNQEVAVG